MAQNVLAIVAMPEEQEYFVRALQEESSVKTTQLACGISMIQGTINHRQISMILSGIGKVRAAIATSLAIEAVSPDCVINIGVAGGLQGFQKPGDFVVADGVFHHDVDVTAFGYKKGQLPEMPHKYEPDPHYSQKIHEIALEQGVRSSLGVVLSGDRFVASQKDREQLLSFSPTAHAVDMESASIAQTSFLYGRPFVIARSISDLGDDQAAENYEEFLKMAAERAGKMLFQFLLKN